MFVKRETSRYMSNIKMVVVMIVMMMMLMMMVMIVMIVMMVTVITVSNINESPRDRISLWRCNKSTRQW